MSDAPSDQEISLASLPPAVRDRIGRVVGVALPDLAPADVPAGLRHLLRFTPAKRRRLGTDLVAAAVCEQPRFRAALVELLNTSSPEVLDLESEDPVAAATAALLRTDPQAQQHMARAGELDELQALRGELSSVRRRLQRTERERDRWAAELAAHQATATEEAASAAEEEAQRLRTRLREQGQRLREATDAVAELAERQQEHADGAVQELAKVRAAWERDRSRLGAERARADRAEQERERARESAREAREADEVRLGLLLSTLDGVARGLRTELGLSPRIGAQAALPAERVVRTAQPPVPGDCLDTVGMLDRALMLSQVHLIVDGYNVTKTGYPQLTLAAQRDRLVRDLGLLAAQVDAEVTVVFDGAAVVASGGQVWARGVRVVFSAAEVIADDVIRELVAAEPQGRPVVVVSSDREVADSGRGMGAHSVAAAVLVSRLVR